MNKAYFNQNAYFGENVRAGILTATAQELRIRTKFNRKKDALKSVAGRAFLFICGIFSLLMALKFLTL